MNSKNYASSAILLLWQMKPLRFSRHTKVKSSQLEFLMLVCFQGSFFRLFSLSTLVKSPLTCHAISGLILGLSFLHAKRPAALRKHRLEVREKLCVLVTEENSRGTRWTFGRKSIAWYPVTPFLGHPKTFSFGSGGWGDWIDRISWAFCDCEAS